MDRSIETRVGGPRGPKPGRPPDAPIISKRRAARLKKEAAIARAVAPDFTGNPKEYLYAVLRGEIAFDPGRVSVADKLARLEPMTHEQGPTLETLVAAAHASVPPPPKEHAERPDPFVEEMLRLSYERFEILMREYARTERQLRLCGDTARANELKHKREDAIAGWNRAAELERAKLVE